MLPKLACPICGRRTISGWRKLVTSPWTRTPYFKWMTCSGCKGRVTVDLSGRWKMFLLEAGVLVGAMSVIRPAVVAAAVIAAMVLTGAWYHYRYVPLVPYGR